MSSSAELFALQCPKCGGPVEYNKEKDVEISAFLKYIKTQEATDDFTNRLKTFVEKAKHNKELRSYYLSMNIHDSDIRRVAFQEGAEQKAIETAKEALKKNVRIKDLVLEYGLMGKEELEKILVPKTTKFSSIYKTKAMYYENQQDFYNKPQNSRYKAG